MHSLSRVFGSEPPAPPDTVPDTRCEVRPHVTALVVDTTAAIALPTADVLARCALVVTVADSFARAKERLAECPPALLVTELRLREYNGLHLVLRGKARRPSMAAVVMSEIDDTVLQSDTEALGATFVVRPIDTKHFTAAALRTLLRPSVELEPIRPPFERRLQQTRILQRPVECERRHAERRRDLVSLLGVVAGVS